MALEHIRGSTGDVEQGQLDKVDELIETAERVSALRRVPDLLGNVFDPTRRALKAIELRLYGHAVKLAAEIWEAGTEGIET
jgi:hypothetical protein